MSKINTAILKIASHCNLNCSYCYVYNHADTSFRQKSKFISINLLDSFIQRIIYHCQKFKLDQFNVVFHGGEPTLIGPKKFSEICEKIREECSPFLINFTIQTNATLIDNAWLNIFEKFEIGIGVSLDGNEVSNSERVFHSGKSSYLETVQGLSLMLNKGLDPKILCVINPNESGLEVFKHFLDLGITSMDFLIPDVSHDSKNQFYGNCAPTPISDYLIPIFNEWFELDNPAIRIRIFEEIISSLLGNESTTDAFGNSQLNYIIVETNGNLEIIDALRVCKEGIGNSKLNISEHNFEDITSKQSLISKVLFNQIDPASICKSCDYFKTCGGGFLPHRYSKENEFDNVSVWCQDIKILINHIKERLHQYELQPI